jgi:ribosomal-protein-alanine N-acetyltransferase
MMKGGLPYSIGNRKKAHQKMRANYQKIMYDKCRSIVYGGCHMERLNINTELIQPGFIRLETERMVLRDHYSSDFETHHTLLSDETAMYYLPDIRTRTMAESETNLQFAMKEIGISDRAHVFLRMEDKPTGSHIGEIGYTVNTFTPLGKLADLGYFTYPRCWNQGYTSEAVKELLRFAFMEDGVYRMSVGCLKENPGSERVMQKCGFIKEAEFKQFVWHFGKLKDRVVYRLLKDEWLRNTAPASGSVVEAPPVADEARRRRLAKQAVRTQ